MTGELMTAKARDMLFQEMAPVTQEAAKAGLDKLKAGFQIALLVQFDLGVLVDQVFSDESLNEEQKKIEIKRLAQYWNQPTLGPTTLYDLRNVAAAFTRDFVKAQVEERMSNGSYLTWSHFRELQKIGSEKKQLAVLKQIRQHCWSAKELALELQGKKEAEIKRAGGRKPTMPKTPNAMLQKIFASVQQTDNYLTAVAEPLEGIFLEMPPQDVSPQFVENIDNTLTRIDEMETHLKETRSKLRKVRTRANSVLSAAEEPSAVAAKKAAADTEDETVPVKAPTPRPPAGKASVRKMPRRVTA